MIFLVVTGVAWAVPAAAQVDEVTLSIEGMTWQLCAVQAERALRRLEGVAAVRITLAEKSAVVTLKAGMPFEPNGFRTAIQSASQEVRTLEVRLRATVDRQDARYYLRLPGSAQRFAVLRGASTDKVVALVGKQVRARGRLVSTTVPFELELTAVGSP
jgi:copper chaperone CopZ